MVKCAQAATRNRVGSNQSLKLELLESRTMLTTLFVTEGGNDGPGSFREAVDQASLDPAIDQIIVKNNVETITIDQPVVYSGPQHLSINGNDATLQPEAGEEGVFDLLVSSAAADLTIHNLSVEDGANGIFVPVPADSDGEITLDLRNVNVEGNGLFGLLFDDQDVDGSGSNASLDLRVADSNFVGNGIAQSDFDGLRVEEGGPGDITATVINSHFDANGGDGLELDERGEGTVELNAVGSSFNQNGFFDPDDLEDGLDLDEADGGDLRVSIRNSTFNGNFDEGMDLDEAQQGHVDVSLVQVQANDNEDEGVKINEAFDDDGVSSDGDLYVSLVRVEANGSQSQEGIAITEEGAGALIAELRNVVAQDNDKEGIELSESGVDGLFARLANVDASGNQDDGIQIEESDGGDLDAFAMNIVATHNQKFGLKVIQDGIGDDTGELRLRKALLANNGEGALETTGVAVV